MRAFPQISNIGLKLGATTAITGAILDQQQDIKLDVGLYKEAWTTVLINLLFLGPFVFNIVEKNTFPKKFLLNVFDTISLVVVHSGLYSVIHRCMHKVVAFRPIHKFHHKFKNIVMPSSANAVSASEFLIMYMLPFVVGCKILSPSKTSLVLSSSIVSLLNLCVHSKNLRLKQWIPGFVKPADHLDHHLKKTKHYSAPTFDWKKIFKM